MNKSLISHIRALGPRGIIWLEALDDIIAGLAKQWCLTEIRSVEQLNWNYLATAMSSKYGPVCIKVSVDQKWMADEVKALAYFNGVGMVSLLDYHARNNAILLDQAIPGYSLKSQYHHNPHQAMVTYSKVIKQL